MSQHTPQERNLQPLPAWMLKDEEKTGGNAGAGGEEAPSPAQTQEPEHTPRALPERKAVVPSSKPPVVSREEVQPSARGKDVLMRVVVGVILGAIIGAGIGYLVGQSALGAVVGAGIGAVGLGLIALVPGEVWEALGDLFEELGPLLDAAGGCCECCSFFFVLSGACIVTLGGLLLWHSFALATLAGVGVMTVLLVVLSAWARSYKARSPSSSSRKVSHDEQGTAVLESSLHGTGSQA